MPRTTRQVGQAIAHWYARTNTCCGACNCAGEQGNFGRNDVCIFYCSTAKAFLLFATFDDLMRSGLQRESPRDKLLVTERPAHTLTQYATVVPRRRHDEYGGDFVGPPRQDIADCAKVGGILRNVRGRDDQMKMNSSKRARENWPSP